MLMSTPRIPGIFKGAEDYRNAPELLELAQKTFNEEALYGAIGVFAKRWAERTRLRKARILDLCSATGLLRFELLRQSKRQRLF